MYLIRGFQAGEGRGKGSQKPIIFKGNRSIALPPPGGGGWRSWKPRANVPKPVQWPSFLRPRACDPQVLLLTEIFHTYLVGCTLPETDRHSFDIMAHCSSSHVPWKRLKQTLSFWFISFFNCSHHVLYLHCTSWSELLCVNCSRCLRRDHRCGGMSWCKTWNIGVSFSFPTLALLFRAGPRVWRRHLGSWSCRQSIQRFYLFHMRICLRMWLVLAQPGLRFFVKWMFTCKFSILPFCLLVYVFLLLSSVGGNEMSVIAKATAKHTASVSCLSIKNQMCLYKIYNRFL